MGFRRTVEDFACEHCGARVRGDGYTNHCPRCLWSKHVDVEPGDRDNDCGGLLEPYGVLAEGDRWVVLHRCVRCRATMRCRTSPADDRDALLAIAATREPPRW